MVEQTYRFRALLLVFIYCLGVYMTGVRNNGSHTSYSGSKESQFAKVSPALSPQNTASQWLIQPQQSPQTNFQQHNYTFTPPFFSVGERIYAAIFRQHFFDFLCHNFRLAVSDIIFPFHYFW